MHVVLCTSAHRRWLHLAVLLLVSSLASPVHAQTIEFEPPAQIEVLGGKLSVTFHAGVSEADGRALLDSLGYVVEAVSFPPVQVQALTEAPLTEAQRAALLAQPRAQSVSPLLTGSDQAPYSVSVLFEPGTTTPQAAAAVRSVSGLRIQSVSTRPNEIVIVLPDAEEATERTAIDTLEDSPLVRYVAYVAAQ